MSSDWIGPANTGARASGTVVTELGKGGRLSAVDDGYHSSSSTGGGISDAHSEGHGDADDDVDDRGAFDATMALISRALARRGAEPRSRAPERPAATVRGAVRATHVVHPFDSDSDSCGSDAAGSVSSAEQHREQAGRHASRRGRHQHSCSSGSRASTDPATSKRRKLDRVRSRGGSDDEAAAARGASSSPPPRANRGTVRSGRERGAGRRPQGPNTRCSAQFLDANLALTGFGDATSALYQAVKELLENSLDAGASRVNIRLTKHISRAAVLRTGGSSTLTLQTATTSRRSGRKHTSTQPAVTSAEAWTVEVEDDGTGIEACVLKKMIGTVFASSKAQTLLPHRTDADAGAGAGAVEVVQRSGQSEPSEQTAGMYGVGLKALILYAQRCHLSSTSGFDALGAGGLGDDEVDDEGAELVERFAEHHERMSAAAAPLHVVTTTAASDVVTVGRYGIDPLTGEIRVAEETQLSKGNTGSPDDGDAHSEVHAAVDAAQPAVELPQHGTVMRITLKGDFEGAQPLLEAYLSRLQLSLLLAHRTAAIQLSVDTGDGSGPGVWKEIAHAALDEADGSTTTALLAETFQVPEWCIGDVAAADAEAGYRVRAVLIADPLLTAGSELEPPTANDLMQNAQQQQHKLCVLHVMRFARGFPLLQHGNACALTRGSIVPATAALQDADSDIWPQFGLKIRVFTAAELAGKESCSRAAAASKPTRGAAVTGRFRSAVSQKLLDLLASLPATTCFPAVTGLGAASIDADGAFFVRSAVQDLDAAYLPFASFRLLLYVDTPPRISTDTATDIAALPFATLAKTHLLAVDESVVSALTAQAVRGALGALRDRLPPGLLWSSHAVHRQVLLEGYIPTIARELSMLVRMVECGVPALTDPASSLHMLQQQLCAEDEATLHSAEPTEDEWLHYSRRNAIADTCGIVSTGGAEGGAGIVVAPESTGYAEEISELLHALLSLAEQTGAASPRASANSAAVDAHAASAEPCDRDEDGRPRAAESGVEAPSADPFAELDRILDACAVAAVEDEALYLLDQRRRHQ